MSLWDADNPFELDCSVYSLCKALVMLNDSIFLSLKVADFEFDPLFDFDFNGEVLDFFFSAYACVFLTFSTSKLNCSSIPSGQLSLKFFYIFLLLVCLSMISQTVSL